MSFASSGANMISSNTRASRSRYSSPAQNGSSGAGGGPLESSKSSNEASRTFMQRWLEPEVQNKATFEEAGFSRYGVLENMQPLGTFPKGSVVKKTNGLATESVKERTPKIILKASSSSGNNSGSSAGNSSSKEKGGVTTALNTSSSSDIGKRAQPASSTHISTSPRTSLPPKSQPPNVSAETSSIRGILPELAPPRPTARRSVSLRDLEDTDYEPSANPRSQATQPSLRTPLSRRSSRPTAGRTSALILTPTGSTVGIMAAGDGDTNDDICKVVKEAIVQALRFYRYPTAWALESLWEERSSDPKFVSMVEDVFYQRADADTYAKFATLVSEKKREGKKENKACYHFVRPATSSGVVVHSPKPAPFGNLLTAEFSTVQNMDSDLRAHKKHKASHHESPSMLRSRRRERERESGIRETSGKFATPRGFGSRKRSDSHSSDSSLSSAISLSSPEIHTTSAARRGKFRTVRSSPFGFGGHVNRDHASLSAAAPSGGTDMALQAVAGGAAEGSTSSHGETWRGAAPSRSEPIKSAGKTLDSQRSHSPQSQPAVQSAAPSPKKQNRDHNTTGSLSPTHPGHASHDTSAPMPGIVDQPLFPNRPTAKSPSSSSSSRVATGSGTGMKDDGYAAPISRSRESLMPDAANGLRATADDSSNDAFDGPITGTSRRSRTANKPPPVYNYSRRSTRKRSHDELEGTASPTALSFTLASARTSRAPTPALPPAKRQRTGPRVKESPKKSGSTTAGVPRPTGEGSASSLTGANRDQTENDEYCSSCGQNGILVCCDNCSKSFHLECFDFVGSYELPDDGSEEDWFCNECAAKRGLLQHDQDGAFASLMASLARTNPRAFSLPKKLQTYFEGVKVGSNGEYEEHDGTKPGRKEKKEEIDWFQQRDADGNTVLCHGCEKAAGDNKPILSCSVCPLYWHLDCLDPPMPHPPNPKKWVCPCHIDPLFVSDPPLGPAHRFRKIRGAQPIEPAYGRGVRNNGVIEIVDDENSADDESGWRDIKVFGRVHRLPASGVKLDFIEQLHKRRAALGREAHEPTKTLASPVPSTVRASPDTAAGWSYANKNGQKMWAETEAQAAIGLCLISDSRLSGIVPLEEEKKEKEAQLPASILTLFQNGALSRDSLTARQKQALREQMDAIKALLAEDCDGDRTQDSIVHTDLASDGLASTPDALDEATTPKADVVGTLGAEATEKAVVEATAEVVKAGDGELRIVDEMEEEVASIPKVNPAADVQEPKKASPRPEPVATTIEFDPSGDDRELGKLPSPKASAPNSPSQAAVEDEKEMIKTEESEDTPSKVALAPTPAPTTLAEMIKIPDSDGEHEPLLEPQTTVTATSAGQQQSDPEAPQTQVADVMAIDDPDAE